MVEEDDEGPTPADRDEGRGSQGFPPVAHRRVPISSTIWRVMTVGPFAGTVDQEPHPRDQQVGPCPEKLEDGETGQRRETERQDDLTKIWKSVAPSTLAHSMISRGRPRPM